ncbi:MAG: hypothetical protein RIM84_15645 [Alphaproteobacteria bacterium]
MDLLVNELSLHGQFNDLAAFRVSIRRVMLIRGVARRHMRGLFCHRGLVNGQVTQHERMSAAVHALPDNERRVVMVWLSQGGGPFWDDDRQHDGGDWYECDGEIVTDTAVGEAAHCVLRGIDRGLVSLEPSNFVYDPVKAERVFDDENRVTVDVRNYWESEALEASFAGAPPALASWRALRKHSAARFEHLRFVESAFDPLRSQPFKQGVAERILARLEVLNRLKQCFDADGSRTAEGHALYQQHFTGDKAWFSDESDANKADFESDLTFGNPDVPGENLFCSWHGKVKSPQYRIHFTWPVTAMSPLYVVYVGPKITKR